MTYLMQRILSFFLTFFAFLGLINPAPKEIMAYTQEELTQLDKYLSHAHGAGVSLYAKKGDADPIFTGRVSDLCALFLCFDPS